MMIKIWRSVVIVAFSFFLVACDDSDSVPETTANAVGSSPTFRWKIVTTWPANFPVLQEGVEKFARDIELMSHGRLQIQVFAGGELVPALQVFDAVSQGAVEMGHGAAYYWAGKIPAAQFFTSVPFGMTAKGMQAWLYQGGGLELWREIYAPFHVMPFPLGNSGVQMGGWYNKQITSLDDLKGLRMRMPGLGGKVLKKAGGNPVLISGGEIYTALERGTIDATEWLGPFHDLRLGLDRAANYYYFPGWHEPGSELELLINKTRWQALPQDLQQIVKVAAAANGEWMYSAFEFRNSQALLEIKRKKNVKLLELPQDVLAELRRLTRITLEEEAAKNADFARVYAAYKKFQENYADWNEIADKSYEKSLSYQGSSQH